jgi:hypothetical protein
MLMLLLVSQLVWSGQMTGFRQSIRAAVALGQLFN